MKPTWAKVQILADSSLGKSDMKRLNIMDSTTITQFKDILKGVGRNPDNALYKSRQEFDIPDDADSGVLKDEEIELMYKQLKQNFPLKYFLGDNENAIIIQIWSVMLADLLLMILKSQIYRTTMKKNLIDILFMHTLAIFLLHLQPSKNITHK